MLLSVFKSLICMNTEQTIQFKSKCKFKKKKGTNASVCSWNVKGAPTPLGAEPFQLRLVFMSCGSANAADNQVLPRGQWIEKSRVHFIPGGGRMVTMYLTCANQGSQGGKRQDSDPHLLLQVKLITCHTSLHLLDWLYTLTHMQKWRECKNINSLNFKKAQTKMWQLIAKVWLFQRPTMQQYISDRVLNQHIQGKFGKNRLIKWNKTVCLLGLQMTHVRRNRHVK